MTISMVLGFLWIVAGAIVAMLPMRLQFLPGSILLISCLPLLFFIGYENGWWIAGLGLAAVLSMFRKPLMYYMRRAMGLPVELPKEIKDAMDARK